MVSQSFTSDNIGHEGVNNEEGFTYYNSKLERINNEGIFNCDNIEHEDINNKEILAYNNTKHEKINNEEEFTYDNEKHGKIDENRNLIRLIINNDHFYETKNNIQKYKVLNNFTYGYNPFDMEYEMSDCKMIANMLYDDIEKFYNNINMYNNKEINHFKDIFTNIKDEIIKAVLDLARREVIQKDKEILENYAKNILDKNLSELINNGPKAQPETQNLNKTYEQNGSLCGIY